MENKIQFYGRRKARPLRDARQEAFDTVLPKVRINGPKDALAFNFTPRETWLEIGFGNGDSLAAWHKAYPDVAFVGCEPFINGVSNLCKLVVEDDLSNLRIWPDAMQGLLPELPDASFDRIYLLNSDPWPKKRHHRRRVVQTETLKLFSRLLKAGGTLVMTTDHDTLAEWMLEHALAEPTLEWTAESKADWEKPPEGWMETRYEGKGKEAGRKQRYLVFRKKN